MFTPRDYHKVDTIGWVFVARVYSNIVSPPIIFAVLGLVVSMVTLPILPALAWFTVYGFWVSLFPILFVLFLLRTGRVQELHMTNTRERHLPYVVATSGSAVALTLVNWLEGPELLRCLAIFNTLELAVLGIVNLFWLISLHATGITSAFVMTGLIWGWSLALIVVMPLVVSVCLVRLYLRRHTFAQVVAGLILGTATVLVLVPFGCFV